MKANSILYKKHCVLIKEVDEFPVFVCIEELFVRELIVLHRRNL